MMVFQYRQQAARLKRAVPTFALALFSHALSPHFLMQTSEVTMTSFAASTHDDSLPPPSVLCLPHNLRKLYFPGCLRWPGTLGKLPGLRAGVVDFSVGSIRIKNEGRRKRVYLSPFNKFRDGTFISRDERPQSSNLGAVDPNAPWSRSCHSGAQHGRDRLLHAGPIWKGLFPFPRKQTGHPELWCSGGRQCTRLAQGLPDGNNFVSPR